MSAKKSAEPSPESIARFNRQRLAAEDGARALADVEGQALRLEGTWRDFESSAKPRKGRRSSSGIVAGPLAEEHDEVGAIVNFNSRR